jgi:hypothetical protein
MTRTGKLAAVALALLVPAAGPPGEKETAAARGFPKQSPPFIALVGLDANGRVMVRYPVRLPDGSDGGTAESFDPQKVRARTAEGKTVKPKKLRKLLKDETFAFVSADGQETVDPRYLRLMRHDALILTLPEPDAVPAQPAPRVAEPPLPQKPARKKSEKESKKPTDRPQTPARVGEIIIIGNTKVPQETILKQVPLVPGQVLDYSDIQTAKKNLAGLGLFRKPPTVTVEDDDGSAYRNIVIRVEEK